MACCGWQDPEVSDNRWRLAPTSPHPDYEYEVNGQIEYGFTGYSSKEINKVGDAVDGLGELRIRFDPVDPYMNRVLNEDKPGLPFAIDHDVP
jgi:hypothetical protein